MNWTASFCWYFKDLYDFLDVLARIFAPSSGGDRNYSHRTNSNVNCYWIGALKVVIRNLDIYVKIIESSLIIRTGKIIYKSVIWFWGREMKGLVWALMFFYLLVTVYWIANSLYLFSRWGVIVWLISILLGFVAFKKIKEKNIMKKLMLYSTSFMVFLLIVTGFIHLAVTSMP